MPGQEHNDAEIGPSTGVDLAPEYAASGQSLFEFLDRLGQELTRLTDADEIMAVITRLTAEHLNLSNCAYADMDDDEDGFTIRGNWHAPGSPSILGHYSLADFGKLAVQELGAGRPLIINDNRKEIAPEEAENFQSIGIGATICMPLVSGGRLRALMAIHDKDPHYWTGYERHVIREVTDRSWAHIERVRAEAELRASSERFRAAVEATRGVLWTNDANGQMVGDQPGWVSLTGQSYDEYKGYGWTSAVHPEDANATLEAWQEAVEQRRTFIFEHRLRRFDGEWRLCSIRAVPVTDDEGVTVEWVGVHTDITEERTAEESLQEETRILETLNKTGSALAAQLNLESLVQTVTDAGVELTGAHFGAFFYNVENATGESYMLFTLSGASPSQFDFGMPRATGVFHPTFAGEGVIRSNDITQDARYGKNEPHFGMPKGHLPVVSYLAVPVKSRSSDVLGGLFFGHPEPGRFSEKHERIIVGIAAQAAVAIDNARLYKAVQLANETLELSVQERTAELATAHEALAQSQKLQALGQLAGGIAHDFNNLMTVVSGSADFLLRKPDLPSPKRQQYIQAIADTAQRASDLTSHLLAFGRRQAIKPEIMDVDLRIDAFSDVLSRTLGSRIAVVLDLGASPVMTRIDSTQFETAILNAAVNARDAMPDGGKLTITTSVEPEGARQMLRVCVSDTGLGMPSRVIERAFEPFYTTKEIGKGTGLGLSQIHGFAAQAGGHAEISSEEGSGTSISVLLPISHEPPLHSASPSETDAIRPGLRVLLVEDNERVRTFAVQLLADLGCHVIAADDAQSALEALSTHGFDLMLTDVVMPGMSGVELARTARQLHPKLPVLLATGYSDEILRNQPEFPVLPKPYTTSALIGALGLALNG